MRPAQRVIKKGLVLRPALKGSLNLKVSKGPEETTGRNQGFLKNQTGKKYLRVFPDYIESDLQRSDQTLRYFTPALMN